MNFKNFFNKKNCLILILSLLAAVSIIIFLIIFINHLDKLNDKNSDLTTDLSSDSTIDISEDGFQSGGKGEGVLNENEINDSQTDTEPVDHDTKKVKVAETLKDYYFENLPNGAVAVLADVTNDDIEELIVVMESPDYIEGYVYAIKDDKVALIYTKRGGHYHIDGFFAWYIIQGPDSDSYYLAEETFGMWQGMGRLDLEVYNFDSFSKNVIEKHSVESFDEPVNPQDYDVYRNKISNIIGKSYSIYSNITESSKKPLPLNNGKFTVLVNKTNYIN